jgi:hypothetical protein
LKFLDSLRLGTQLNEMMIRTAAASFCENRKHRKEGPEQMSSRFLPKGYCTSPVDLSTTDGNSVQDSVKTPVQTKSALKEISTQSKVSVNDPIVPREGMDISAPQTPSSSESGRDLDFFRHEVIYSSYNIHHFSILMYQACMS